MEGATSQGSGFFFMELVESRCDETNALNLALVNLVVTNAILFPHGSIEGPRDGFHKAHENVLLLLFYAVKLLAKLPAAYGFRQVYCDRTSIKFLSTGDFGPIKVSLKYRVEWGLCELLTLVLGIWNVVVTWSSDQEKLIGDGIWGQLLLRLLQVVTLTVPFSNMFGLEKDANPLRMWFLNRILGLRSLICLKATVLISRKVDGPLWIFAGVCVAHILVYFISHEENSFPTQKVHSP